MTALPKSSFADPALNSQRVFRAAMMAMSRPGTLHELDIDLGPPEPLNLATAALALALCDFETPVWLDPALATPEIAAWLRFETSAPIVSQPGSAAFALIGAPLAMPEIESFGMGTLENPDRSTTLIIQVETLSNETGWSLAGPGVAGETRLLAQPLRDDCAREMLHMRSLFPRGVDIFFSCGRRLAALPRSVLIEA